jgi:hypothetical protein
MYTVLVRIDELGEWPIFVGDDDPLLTGPGVRFRYVARVKDRLQALTMIVRLYVHPPRARQGACGPCQGPKRASAGEAIGSPAMCS